MKHSNSKHSDSDSIHESCASSLKLMGDYWTLMVISTLRSDSQRFCDLQRAMDNINPATLSSRLKALEESGLVDREEETVSKVSVVYSLTDVGRRALPVIDAIENFSKHEEKAIS